ncbi:MFS transporter [Ohessyouella blattaphilus]|uniref:MFS transporter n=1 Tax=Ohessyouella blattaphilus TaxID=2949333 RepID=A0ABT1EFZ3_9FIRM|nr:MFS transporter [Ohessyouella blattaphilus]MCP1109573.1 MFS transporter [Ohessyouella blattaphilus]MCR8562967.1 MFS transporter [Ohessyouella blattaphilus]MDL2250578.1 MFS transporter [Lachnospiraceae bacterium OttesenSCG-928-J05]
MEEKKLFHKDFVLVVIGQIISLFGNGILRFALPLYILDQSGSPALFGMVSALSFVPMVLISPIGGVLADRVNKQRIMVILDFLTAGILLVFTFASKNLSIVPLIIIVMMLLYSIQGLYSPAVQASMPLLHNEDRLVTANAIVNLVQSLAGLLGPIIGGFLYANFGLWPIVYIATGCFAASAVLELFIRIPFYYRKNSQGVIGTIVTDLRESNDFVFKAYPVMKRVIYITFFINLFMSTMIIIGLPVIITQHLHLSSELYGISQGVIGCGGLVGGVLAGSIARKIKVEDSWKMLIPCALSIFPIALVLIVGTSSIFSYIVITAMSMLVMVCSTIFSIIMLAFAQQVTPPHLVGKVISVVMAINLLAQPLGQSLFGVAFERFAHAPGLVVLAAALLSLFVALYSKSCFAELRKPSMLASQKAFDTAL